MDYTGFVADLARWGRVTNPATNVTWLATLPNIITLAEQRIYRDLDLLATMVTDTGTTIVNTRTFTLPQNVGLFTILHDVNLINGTDRTPLVKINRAAMDMLFPNSVTGLTPTRWAPLTDQIILLGPSPGGVSTLECIGNVTPDPISASNANTFLSDVLPDLFFASAMVALTGYMQNWGAQADNPQAGLSWEEYYKKLLASADSDEMRRKFSGFRVR